MGRVAINSKYCELFELAMKIIKQWAIIDRMSLQDSVS